MACRLVRADCPGADMPCRWGTLGYGRSAAWPVGGGAMARDGWAAVPCGVVGTGSGVEQWHVDMGLVARGGSALGGRHRLGSAQFMARHVVRGDTVCRLLWVSQVCREGPGAGARRAGLSDGGPGSTRDWLVVRDEHGHGKSGSTGASGESRVDRSAVAAALQSRQARNGASHDTGTASRSGARLHDRACRWGCAG